MHIAFLSKILKAYFPQQTAETKAVNGITLSRNVSGKEMNRIARKPTDTLAVVPSPLPGFTSGGKTAASAAPVQRPLPDPSQH